MGKQWIDKGVDKMKKLVKTLRDRMIGNFEVMSGLKWINLGALNRYPYKHIRT